MPGFNTISISKITTIGLFTVAILGPFSVVKLCEKWLKMSNLTFLVRFLSVFFFFFFFFFFLLNVIYLGYEILLQSFTEFCSAVVKLCEKWGVKNVNYDISGIFSVCFL